MCTEYCASGVVVRPTQASTAYAMVFANAAQHLSLVELIESALGFKYRLFLRSL